MMECFYFGSFRGIDLRNNIMINDHNMAENLDEFFGFIPEYDEIYPFFKSCTSRVQSMNLTLEEIIILKAIAITSPGRYRLQFI